MAGTDATKEPIRGGPAVVLVDTQLGQNVGTAARAMLNCGLDDLRLVRPRDGWPNPWAEKAASGAGVVLERARVFETTRAAVADLCHLYAATTRRRDMVKPVMTPHRAAAEMRRFVAAGEACGIMFGPERSGLVNDDVAMADAVVEVPLNPAFASLNLAQAVLILGYEWYQSGDRTPERVPSRGQGRAATKAELANFLERLEGELDACGFLHLPEMRPTMVRNIRNIFQRAGLRDREVRTLHGILSGLIKGRSGDG
ncbi:MAG: RNA methyltransferase [Kiloniellales bacterium]